MLQTGQLFAGRYLVKGLLAQGGMGAIFEAEHVATEERVALKVLWPHVLGSAGIVAKFQLEARIAARLGSENIVRILDAGYDETLRSPFLVMELLRGQTFEALVRERGRLAPAEVLGAFRQIACALDRAHGYVDPQGRPAPIVHRDLKPENLFVAERPSGGGSIVKVLDFGIAKVLSESHHVSQELNGTPLFMASEQLDGGRVTPQLDVWALGLIAFYLLTGRHYWRGADNPDAGLAPLFNEVLRLPLEPPTERVRAAGAQPPWPPAFDAWFLRCVHREPGQRFVSAGEAVEALAEALGAPPDAHAARPPGGLDLDPLVTAATSVGRGFWDDTSTRALTIGATTPTLPGPSATPIEAGTGPRAERQALTGRVRRRFGRLGLVGGVSLLVGLVATLMMLSMSVPSRRGASPGSARAEASLQGRSGAPPAPPLSSAAVDHGTPSADGAALAPSTALPSEQGAALEAPSGEAARSPPAERTSNKGSGGHVVRSAEPPRGKPARKPRAPVDTGESTYEDR